MKSAEKERLIKSDILSIESQVRHAFNQGYDLGYKEGIKKNKKQPKTGHWIHFASSDDCSECGWSTGKYESPSKFCPNCGIKMIDVPDTNIGKVSEIPTGSEKERKEEK